jgi:hypothetical protein
MLFPYLKVTEGLNREVPKYDKMVRINRGGIIDGDLEDCGVPYSVLYDEEEDTPHRLEVDVQKYFNFLFYYRAMNEDRIYVTSSERGRGLIPTGLHLNLFVTPLNAMVDNCQLILQKEVSNDAYAARNYLRSNFLYSIETFIQTFNTGDYPSVRK